MKLAFSLDRFLILIGILAVVILIIGAKDWWDSRK